jgi:hypothetical protein
MRRFAVVLAATAVVMGLFAQAALAQNAHLKGRTPISFSDGGLTLTATVSYAGLGNFDTEQSLTATGNTTSTCTNQGGTQAPGQNPAPTTVSGGTAVPADDIKNGNVTITTVTNAPVTPIPGAPGCPNPNWTEAINDIAFTSATITLRQDQDASGTFETLVLTVNCTFSSPTSNGTVPRTNFSCTAS